MKQHKVGGSGGSSEWGNKRLRDRGGTSRWGKIRLKDGGGTNG